MDSEFSDELRVDTFTCVDMACDLCFTLEYEVVEQLHGLRFEYDHNEDYDQFYLAPGRVPEGDGENKEPQTGGKQDEAQ